MKRPPAVWFVVPAACAIALAAGAATDDTDGGSAVPDDTTLEAAGAVIGKIEIDAGPIFDTDDPKENKAVFRAANKLHVTTHEGVIRRQLSFAEGDPYSRRVLDESERHLRHNGYLYDAKIRPVHYDGHAVDVVVTTRDVWTLRPGAGFGRSGGVNRAASCSCDRRAPAMSVSFGRTYDWSPLMVASRSVRVWSRAMIVGLKVPRGSGAHVGIGRLRRPR